MGKITAMIEKFKESVEAYAYRLIEAVGGYETPNLKGALYGAYNDVLKKDVWESGSVYDPEYPVRLAIIQAALEKAPFGAEDDWVWDFLYQSPTRKYTSDMDAKAWSETGWDSLLKELEEFGEEDLGHLVTKVNELKKEV